LLFVSPISQELTNVLGRIKSSGIKYSVRKEFKAAAFSGASIKVPEGVTAADLLKVDGVEVRVSVFIRCIGRNACELTL
jgi:hypothetical protein